MQLVSFLLSHILCTSWTICSSSIGLITSDLKQELPLRQESLVEERERKDGTAGERASSHVDSQHRHRGHIDSQLHRGLSVTPCETSTGGKFQYFSRGLSPSHNGSGRLVVLARREVEEELRSKTWMTTDTPPSSAAGCLQRRHTLLYGFSISY